MRDFNVLQTAASADQLQKVLKMEDLEKYGESFTPEFVYDAIRSHQRFDNMEVSLPDCLLIITTYMCNSVVVNRTPKSFSACCCSP